MGLRRTFPVAVSQKTTCLISSDQYIAVCQTTKKAKVMEDIVLDGEERADQPPAEISLETTTENEETVNNERVFNQR